MRTCPTWLTVLFPVRWVEKDEQINRFSPCKHFDKYTLEREAGAKPTCLQEQLQSARSVQVREHKSTSGRGQVHRHTHTHLSPEDRGPNKTPPGPRTHTVRKPVWVSASPSRVLPAKGGGEREGGWGVPPTSLVWGGGSDYGQVRAGRAPKVLDIAP